MAAPSSFRGAVLDVAWFSLSCCRFESFSVLRCSSAAFRRVLPSQFCASAVGRFVIRRRAGDCRLSLRLFCIRRAVATRRILASGLMCVHGSLESSLGAGVLEDRDWKRCRTRVKLGALGFVLLRLRGVFHIHFSSLCMFAGFCGTLSTHQLGRTLCEAKLRLDGS
jgi:hypothetical protein